MSLKQETSGCTESRECVLATIPVKVKSFMDPESSAMFYTGALMRQLNVQGWKTKILLQTMGQEKPAHSYILPDLEVCGLVQRDCIDLLNVFTCKDILENSPLQDLEKWT